LPGFFGINATKGADLAESEAPAFDPVVDGEAADLEFRFADDGPFFGKGMKEQGIGELDIRYFQLEADDVLQGPGGEDVELVGPK